MLFKHNFIEESVDVKSDKPIQEEEVEEQQPNVEDNEEEQQPTAEDSEEEQAAGGEESEEDEEPKGPLTAVESTCILADMVSKLTLICETASRPLPFVDETIAENFLNCHKKTKDSITTDETDNIKTLEQCFQRYFKPETLSGENLFDCYYCRSLDQTQSIICFFLVL